MSQNESDQRLVARVQRGDRRAFDALVIKYQARIATLIGRFVRDTDEVMDVTQETFIKAYRAIGSFRGDAQFYTWLYRIASNTAKNYLVAKSRRPPDTDLWIGEGDPGEGSVEIESTEGPQGLHERDQLLEALSGGLDNLPEDLKVALVLREFDGLTYEEIAEVMECPVGTVRSRIFRAREALEKIIDRGDKSEA
ncbi:MAG: RNA polymerase sigma factor RpoE [Gammaproteobacteria bacterium]